MKNKELSMEMHCLKKIFKTVRKCFLVFTSLIKVIYFK